MRPSSLSNSTTQPSTPRETRLVVSAYFSPCRLLATTSLPSVSGPPGPSSSHRRNETAARPSGDQPLSLTECSRFVRFVAQVSAWFLFTAKQCSLGRLGRACFSIRQLMDNLRPPFLAIVNNPAMNFHVQVFVWTCVFSSLGVKLLGHVVTQCLTWCGCSILYYYSSIRGIQFLTVS